MRPRRLAIMLTCCLVAASACSGPRRSIEVATKEFPSDVAIGKKKTTVPPIVAQPTAVNPAPVGFPSFIQPPAPFASVVETTAPSAPPPTVKPPVACPAADPLAAPKTEASRTVTGPPARDSLVFRNEGTFMSQDRSGRTRQGRYPERSNRDVVSRVNTDGTFDYAVSEISSSGATQNVYHVDPTKGLYLVQVTTTSSTGTDTFTADRPDALLLLPFPVDVAALVGGVALDVQSATSMRMAGTVTGKARVDACGTLLDTWEVQITDGRITGPGKQVRFTATYHIGTQYGALSVRDVVHFDCDEPVNAYCDNGHKVVIDNTATVASEPKAPAR